MPSDLSRTARAKALSARSGFVWVPLVDARGLDLNHDREGLVLAPLADARGSDLNQDHEGLVYCRSTAAGGRRLGQRGIALIPLLAIVAAVVLIWVFRESILSSAGTFLDNGAQPHKAEAIVVIAGGWRGERIVAAANLKERGFAPLVVVSGAAQFYGQGECPASIDFIRRMGISTEGYVCADSKASSSEEEAAALANFLRGRGLKRVLVVSCDTHMRRVSRLWRKRAPDLDLTFIPAPSPNFDLKRWYKTREGRKAVVLEWSKVITSYFGI